MCTYVGEETQAWAAEDKKQQIVRECWEPIGFLRCWDPAVQVKAALAVAEDKDELYFKSDKDPMQVRCEGDQEEEPEPARTRAVAASDADAVDLSAAPRVIKVKDHLHARVDEIECYIRVDKKARTAGMFHVALCKQSYAENSGQKPRAMKGKGALQMSAAEIKLAIGSL